MGTEPMIFQSICRQRSEKVKDTDTEEELVTAIQVIDHDENKATIKKLIVNSGTSFGGEQSAAV